MDRIFIVKDTFGLSTVHYGDTVIAYIAFRLGYLIAFKLVDEIRILDKRPCEGHQLKIFFEYFADLFHENNPPTYTSGSWSTDLFLRVRGPSLKGVDNLLA